MIADGLMLKLIDFGDSLVDGYEEKGEPVEEEKNEDGYVDFVAHDDFEDKD